MAIYRIKVQLTSVYKLFGKTVKNKDTNSFNDIVNGSMIDVARIMLQRQSEFVKRETLDTTVTKDITTLFTVQDNANDILESGVCTSQLMNKFKDIIYTATLTQVCERIG